MPLNSNFNDYPDDTAAKLVGIMNDLVEATADAALLERLNSATARIADLTSQQNAIVEQQRLATVAKAKAIEDARFSRFSVVDVSDKTPDEHVLRSSFEISWVAIVWDSNAHASVPARHTATGFGALPDGLLDYLIERHPTRIPVKIANLAASPQDAFERYFVSQSRGHIRGNAYDVERNARV